MTDKGKEFFTQKHAALLMVGATLRATETDPERADVRALEALVAAILEVLTDEQRSAISDILHRGQV